MSAAPIAKRDAEAEAQRKAASWYEASARERVRLFLMFTASRSLSVRAAGDQPRTCTFFNLPNNLTTA